MTEEKIPDNNANWGEICDYASLFNGYHYVQFLIDRDQLPNHIPKDVRDRKGALEIMLVLNAPKINSYNETGINDFTIEELKTELFLHWREVAHEGGCPEPGDLETARGLISLIKELYEHSNLVS
jgi:hypothetical protein